MSSQKPSPASTSLKNHSIIAHPTAIAMPDPALLRIYPCPADPCPRYSVSIPEAIDHLSTAHPVFHDALTRDFGQNGLTVFLEPADLQTARVPSNFTVILCLRCRTIHRTAAVAESHVSSDPGHEASAALDRTRYGPAGARCHMPLMRITHAPDVPHIDPPVSPVQYNYIYGANPGLHIANASPTSSSSGHDDDSVMLRALVGRSGAVLTLPRNTRWASLVTILHAREPGVDWERLLQGGMDVEYASVKMDGGAAVMTVTDEATWRRVMCDAVKGARVQWVVDDEGRS